MAQLPERKRVYNRERNRRLRGYGASRLGFAKVSPQRGGEYGRGVVPQNVVPSDTKGKNVVPPKRERNVVPPLNPWTMSKRMLVDYLAYAGERGFTLVRSSMGYELVDVRTGQLGAFDSLAIIEGQLRRQQEHILVQDKRVVQLEGELARLEVMVDSLLAERGYALVEHEEEP